MLCTAAQPDAVRTSSSSRLPMWWRTVRIPSRRATAPPKGPRRAGRFPPAWAWAAASPAVDRSQTVNCPRALTVRCQTARSQSFPTGKCPKCPAASAPHRPVGREAPLTATPQRATVPPIPLQLPNGRDKEKQTARAGRLLFAVCSVLHRLKTDDHAAALGIVAAKTTAGTDLNVCFGKVPA